MPKVSVIGQGYVGLPLAIKAAESGSLVIGYDSDKSKILELQGGKNSISNINTGVLNDLLKQRKYTPTDDPSLIYDSDIIIFAVPTPLYGDGNPDLTFLEEAAKIVAKNCRSDVLIINESTSYPGTLRNIIKPIFLKNFHREILFASAPERIDPGNLHWNLSNTPRVVSGLTDDASQKAANFYKTFCNEVHIVSSPEVAEASKIFENTFRMVNIALANELALISENIGFSAHEAIVAASTKPFGFMPFYPSTGVGGHCIPIDPQYLSYLAKITESNSDLIDLANKINLNMVKVVSKKIKELLGGNLSNKKIQIAGIAYKPNVSDLRESPALRLIFELRNMGATVFWCDPHVSEHNGEVSNELVGNVDLGIIVTPHSLFDFSCWKDAHTKVIDLSANEVDYGWRKFL
jgi:UDP-N-acetyl-D-glucosamine dehydrogenase